MRLVTATLSIYAIATALALLSLLIGWPFHPTFVWFASVVCLAVALAVANRFMCEHHTATAQTTDTEGRDV